jgi:hypothetical protein
MRSILSFVFFLALIASTSGQVTFTKDIAPIIYNNCTKCHRPNEIGPFSMTNYEEIAPWAPTIKYVTSIRYMPPWKADPHYSRFIGERVLTDEQIALIAEWADKALHMGMHQRNQIFQTLQGHRLAADLVLHMSESHMRW